MPVDWLGHQPYWLARADGMLCAALACPVDPEPVAWLRLLACGDAVSPETAWQTLWLHARQDLESRMRTVVAAIATEQWLTPILISAGFRSVEEIVLLQWNGFTDAAHDLPPGARIRPMQIEDLGEITDIDRDAFDPLWHNSLETNTFALSQGCHATVIEDSGGILGFQISSASSYTTHLARLAVRRSAQGRGLAGALVRHLFAHAVRTASGVVTVNTQSGNGPSLALYSRLGFRRTGERYPVYTLPVGPNGTA